MSYIYDVFISYRRHPQWTLWTREHLRGLLDAYLTQDLGRSPSIFIDDRIEPGTDWPLRLGGALGRARVFLPVFSRDYFSSDWCLHELDLMHDRLRQYPNSRLIIPLIGHDGELIPKEIARLQRYDLTEFRNTDLQRHTLRFEKFSDSIKNLAPYVASAIDSAPPFDPAWSMACQARFDEVYTAHCGDGPPVETQTLTLKHIPIPAGPPLVPMQVSR